MALRPATLAQLAAASALPLPAVAAFVSAQCGARAAHLARAVVDASAAGAPLGARFVSELRASADALAAAAGAVAAATAGSGRGAAASLSARADDLHRTVLDGLDARRDAVLALRSTPAGSDAAWQLQHMFDALLLDAMGLQLQAGALRARYGDGGGGASNGDGDGTPPPPPPVRRLPLRLAVDRVLEDVRAFAVEKFGVAPPVEVVVGDGGATGGGGGLLPPLVAPPLVAYAVAELAKNAFAAHVGRYGATGVDDAPPVRVRLGGDREWASVQVSDAGGGLRGVPPPCVLTPPFPYFASTAAAPAGEPNYTYSREFGARFSGLGLGLARAALHARLHGGGLALLSQAGAGTDALLTLRRHGDGGAVDFVPVPAWHGVRG